MTLITAPESTDGIPRGVVTCFLAGSIEMGTAGHWQEKVASALSDLDVVFLNPYRRDFDASQEQRASNKHFAEQVNWELDNIMSSNVMFFYFDPSTKAPITLAEFGMIVGITGVLAPFSDVVGKKLFEVVIVCPDGYWKKGNVEVMCERVGFDVLNDFDSGVQRLREVLESIKT